MHLKHYSLIISSVFLHLNATSIWKSFLQDNSLAAKTETKATSFSRFCAGTAATCDIYILILCFKEHFNNLSFFHGDIHILVVIILFTLIFTIHVNTKQNFLTENQLYLFAFCFANL